MAPPFTPVFINGQWRSASTNETFNVLNPFSRDVVGTSASATGKDCKDAIEAASSAFLTWERTSLSERSAIFLKAADLFATDRYKEKVFGAADETAATDYWSGFQLMAAGRLIRGAVEAAKQLKRETRPATFPGGEVIVERRPHGVVFAIAPWNAAVVLAARAVVIPLLCGNTVVLKSSEASPKSNAIIVEALQEAGLPTGVLNLISMPRESAPALIAETIAHPAVRKINFTGSDRVGKILAMEAAKYLKPCVLELGGKAPAVVLNDADIDEASRAIVSGAMLHSGQICMSTERVIIQRGISQDLISRITSICKTTLKAGDPKSDSSANLSALFSPGLAENVLSLIVEAKSAGAEVLLGDLKVEGGVIQPHLLNGVKPNMTLWQRESFGPVIVFAVVDSVDEAVDLANDSDYSLMASVWSKDGDVAIDTARRIRAGCCAINGTTITSEPTAPLFGMGGATGYGKFDIDNFTDKRAIVVYPSDPKREYPLTG